MRLIDSTAGFSLLEVLVASALLAGAIGVVAALVTRAAEQSGRSQRVTIATTLAQAKLERLRAATFRFDGNGGRVDAAELAPSAADALRQDAPPHVEGLDRFGDHLPPGARPAYFRRWSITTAPDDPDTLVLAVCVVPATEARQADVCVWTIRTRQP